MKAKFLRRYAQLREIRGDTLVLLTVFMVALFAFAALSIDVGNVLVARNRMQEAGDAAALAAVKDWKAGAVVSTVQQVARDFAAANGVATNEVFSVRVGKWENNTFVEQNSITSTNVPAVEVTTRRTIDMLFARVVGFSAMTPGTVSIAICGQANSAARVLPWAACGTIVPAKCAQIPIQFTDSIAADGACSGSGPNSGNFGQITLPGGSGSSWYKNNIISGYQGILSVGQILDTDTGISWGPTTSGIDDRIGDAPPYDCSSSTPPDPRRVGILPRFDSIDVNGKKMVKITGFYTVVINGYVKNTKTVWVTFIEKYDGDKVDTTKPPVVGLINGTALVK